MRHLLFGALLLALGCDAAVPGPPQQAGVAATAAGPGAAASASGRAMERRVELTLALPADRLNAAIQAHAEACAEPDCEVLEVSTAGSARVHRSGSLGLRIQPQALRAYLARLTSAGEVTLRRETAQDLTAPTIDAEARLRTQRSLQERVRGTLATHPDMPLESLLAWEREAARVQGEIEAAEAQLRALESRTGRVTVRIVYQAEGSMAAMRWWQPIEATLGNSLVLLGRSTAVALEFVIQLLPWVPILWLGWVVSRRLGRWWRGRRAAG